MTFILKTVVFSEAASGPNGTVGPARSMTNAQSAAFDASFCAAKRLAEVTSETLGKTFAPIRELFSLVELWSAGDSEHQQVLLASFCYQAGALHHAIFTPQGSALWEAEQPSVQVDAKRMVN